MPTGRLDTESRGILQAMSVLPRSQPPTTTTPLSVPAVKAIAAPITFQFKLQTTKAPTLEVGRNAVKDVTVSAPKTGLLAGFQKALSAVGNVLAGAGRRVVNALKAVVQVFRGKPSNDPTALAQRVQKDFPTLKEVRPGVLQTPPGAQAFSKAMCGSPAAPSRPRNGAPG